jgi:CHAT domain-containing protein
MKHIARIALVVVLLISGMVRPVWCQENVDEYVQELNNKTTAAFKKGDLQQGAILAEQAYRYALEYLGEKHPDTLVAESHIAGLYLYQGHHKKAEALAKKVFQFRKELLGNRHKDTLESMADLSVLYRMLGNYSEAEPLCIKALQLRGEILGEKHPDTLESINSLALLHQAQGRYSKAEPLFKQALQLREKVLGEEHADTLTSINNLAMLYQDQLRYNEAEPLLKQVLQFRKKILGDNHPETLQSMNNLAISYYKQGYYHEAEPLYKEAIKLNKEILGDDHLITLTYQGNLAALYNAEGRYGEAEQLDKEVLLLKKKALGKEHVETLISLNNLAFFYLVQGRYSEAEPLYKEALPCFENKIGINHPDTIGILGNYIILLVNTNRPAMALRLLQELEHRLLSRSFQELYNSSSEKQRIQYLGSIDSFQQVVFSLANQHPGEEYQRYAAEVTLRWKQLYAEERKVQSQMLTLSNTPEAVELKTQFTTPQAKKGLISRFNQNEKALINFARNFRTSLEVENVTLDRVQAALPPNSGLIEYRIVNIADLTNIKKIISDKNQSNQNIRFIAFLISTDSYVKKKVIFRDLGSQEEVANLLRNFFQLKNKSLYFSQKLQKEQPPDAAGLRELIKVLEKKADAETTEIYKKVLFPFDEQINNLKQLYIAPDGPLNLLSFASLRLPDGRFLVERQQINQLQTGRDLLQDKSGVSGKGLVAIGGVKYGSMPAGTAEPASTLAAYQQRAVRELAQGIPDLPESEGEVKTIQTIFTDNVKEDAQVLSGENASEYNLKHLKQPPRILHLSTHGFYLAQDEKSKLAEEAPLLLSGLALAGANNGLQGRVDKHGDDGLLYSLEVLGLNLHGTELVSLSACDTGKGVVDYSEGVYGLVRAFRTAGAKSVLMTLTPVGDKSSRDFMETFYDKWLSSKENISPAEALHETRLQFIRDKKPPQDWAPFVLVGK